MKILFDIAHPKYFHCSKNLIQSLEANGHACFVIARDKECTLDLLHQSKIDFISRGKGGNGFWGRIFYFIKADYLFLKQIKKHKIDLVVSFGSPYAAHAAFIARIPHVAFDDTDHNRFTQLFYQPFTTQIIVPDCYVGKIKPKHLKVNSYTELSYLHPTLFKPSMDVKSLLGLQGNDTYVILRFVSWKAVHDFGYKGLSDEQKIKLVNKLLAFTHVFISSEIELPGVLKPFKLNIPCEKFHDILAHASLCYGESPTIAAEAAVLGVPSLFISNDKRGYTTELCEKYGLVELFGMRTNEFEKSLLRAIEILLRAEEKNDWINKRMAMLKEKENFAEIMMSIIENYSNKQTHFI